MAGKSEATLILRIKEIGAAAIDNVKTKLGSMVPSAQTVQTALKGVGVAFTAVAGAMVTFAEKAGRFEGVKKSFNSLAASQGQDAKAMLANMKELSRGTVSDMKLMEQANNALLLGLPVDRFGDMLKVAQTASVATGQSMDFMLNSIVTGLGRGSKLMLDNLGILVNVEKANKDYANAMGIVGRELTDNEKKQAFVNAALETGLENAEKLGSGNLTLSQSMDVLKSNLDNFTIVMGQAAAPAVSFFTQKLSTLFSEANKGTTESTLETFFMNVGKAATVAWNIFEFVGKQIGTVLAGIGGALTNLIEGNFRAAWDNAKLIVTETGENIKSTWNNVGAELDAIEEGYKEARLQRLRDEGEQKMLIKQEQQVAEEEFDAAAYDKKQQEEMARRQLEIDAIGANDAQKLALQQKRLDLELKNAKTAEQRKKIWQQKMDVQEKQSEQAMTAFKQAEQQARLNTLQSTLGTISSLQNSNNKALAAAGKAAALAQITISTAQGAMSAWALGPIIGPPLAALVVAAGAANAAKVMGVQLAEGGIVRARPGGIQATIGEGGRSEAVVPLPEDFDPDSGLGLGGTINFTFTGPVMGDAAQAREFALMIDEQLLELRRSNESQAFDEDVI